MISVESSIKVYEVDSADISPREVDITIKSHWNDPDFVIICPPDGPELTVKAADIRNAVQNATNVGRFS